MKFKIGDRIIRVKYWDVPINTGVILKISNHPDLPYCVKLDHDGRITYYGPKVIELVENGLQLIKKRHKL